MVRITAALLVLTPALAMASMPYCEGNVSYCPNGQDNVSLNYFQCNNYSHQYESMACPAGQVCFANPNKPGYAMCGLPGTGGIPSAGKCTGNTAKCVSSGQTGNYSQCENWSGQYVNAACPAGLKCYNNAAGNGVYCQ
ncbi:hypothetical protein BX661DRAFT_195561 [Kickxella alabastrina]|uniref:uncharacterized protein n=1 Tax=Kickxella alabastrina TaxID=61397 RepID=UPI00221E393B|nr:uncharacterized protein BX661DRAFT_195561 [Kickxella alabastrina]KAI7835005.1 hypothetical protein BX661DRAFT_195561 [Kickxella alabastrina]KAJ1947637.1 hypothetical protein GGF37_000220 [Kickxella alabastrina]